MPRHNSLAQLELFVLLSLYRHDGAAFGSELRQEIESRTGRNVSLAAVFVTLTRLETRGLVGHRVVQPRPVPGGRARKRFRLTAAGTRKLQAAVDQIRGMLDDLPGHLVPAAR